jgi:hypothetical protein
MYVFAKANCLIVHRKANLDPFVFLQEMGCCVQENVETPHLDKIFVLAPCAQGLPSVDEIFSTSRFEIARAQNCSKALNAIKSQLDEKDIKLWKAHTRETSLTSDVTQAVRDRIRAYSVERDKTGAIVDKRNLEAKGFGFIQPDTGEIEGRISDGRLWLLFHDLRDRVARRHTQHTTSKHTVFVPTSASQFTRMHAKLSSSCHAPFLQTVSRTHVLTKAFR